ncbi:DEAD/DEAH box helicase [Acidipila rosea]|uniref:ATP-dependent RNA helicase RhlE n=1 Tax=Acidipila rosea TaxID=768535 RepID=A0A4R1L1Y7_9BACT|nr:DEAD/DEAH box helicase [Acidipila rosea]MBW4027993.1 DEAD/DEAH box helicase [Acidobacteriota bacterium]MBW4045838.1 DEAD/DEAH box helicase [Acidobacteriota bacterium]TCK71904.1 ATP-dependent RNA helicase RhlE [Acidipila rosea]
MTPFSELNLSSNLKKQLAALNFVTPTPVQDAAIPQAMEGKDVHATAQTGTGKTLSFLIPAIERLQKTQGKHPAVLVLVPTRELALQVEKQYRDLVGRYLPKAAVVIGGASEKGQISDLRGGARVVIATPGRLEDLLERRMLKIDKIEMLILDEADRMLDMGFVPAIRRIVSKIPKERQTLCFSATVDPAVAHLLAEVLRNPVRLSFGSTQKTSSSVKLIAYEVEQSQKAALIHRVVSNEAGQSLIFVGTKRRTEDVARKLERAGVSVAVMHGDRSQSQRNRALESFQKGRAQVLVATDVASRGIHCDNIAQVINYDLPKMAEDFIHRAGRTGRAGATGIAASFYTPIERREIARFERSLDLKIERIAIKENLVREQRGQMVDTAKLKFAGAPAPTRGKSGGRRNMPAGVYLEGESLQKYAAR